MQGQWRRQKRQAPSLKKNPLSNITSIHWIEERRSRTTKPNRCPFSMPIRFPLKNFLSFQDTPNTITTGVIRDPPNRRLEFSLNWRTQKKITLECLFPRERSVFIKKTKTEASSLSERIGLTIPQKMKNLRSRSVRLLMWLERESRRITNISATIFMKW